MSDLTKEHVLGELKKIFKGKSFSNDDLKEAVKKIAMTYKKIKSGDLQSNLSTLHADLVAFDIMYSSLRKYSNIAAMFEDKEEKFNCLLSEIEKQVLNRK